MRVQIRQGGICLTFPDKRFRISALLDTYGMLLSEKQRYALEQYYNEDLSLSETAENIGITRQGVRDLLRHGAEQLETYESALGLYDYRQRVMSSARRIMALTDNEQVRAIAAGLTGAREN